MKKLVFPLAFGVFGVFGGCQGGSSDFDGVLISGGGQVVESVPCKRAKELRDCGHYTEDSELTGLWRLIDICSPESFFGADALGCSANLSNVTLMANASLNLTTEGAYSRTQSFERIGNLIPGSDCFAGSQGCLDWAKEVDLICSESQSCVCDFKGSQQMRDNGSYQTTERSIQFDEAMKNGSVPYDSHEMGYCLYKDMLILALDIDRDIYFVFSR